MGQWVNSADQTPHNADRYCRDKQEWQLCNILFTIAKYVEKSYPLNIKPHSHCAGVGTVHPDAGQPVYRDAPGHIS